MHDGVGVDPPLGGRLAFVFKKTWVTQRPLSVRRQTSRSLLCHTADNVCRVTQPTCVTQQASSLVPHRRHCLLCTLSALTHSRQSLLCETADIVCCVPQQTISAMSHSRHCPLWVTADIVCCATQQTLSAVGHSRYCLLSLIADSLFVAVPHSRECLVSFTCKQ